MEPITLLTALKIIGDIVEMFPNYDQKKLRQYQNALREYERQKTLPFDHPDYSDDVLLNLRAELLSYGEKIKSDLQSKVKSK